MKKNLNGEWILNCKYLKNTAVRVPGSIYNDLIINKIIDEPYYRDNESRMLEYMETDYHYSRNFKLNKNDLSKQIDLCFDGIDTISEIYINDRLIDRTYNMHRRYCFDINKYVVEGLNNLEVIIKSPLAFMREEEKKLRCDLMNMSYAVRGYNHIRKAHCMFGWDWGPQMPDGGIWRNVYLDIYEYGSINDVWFRCENVTKLSTDIIVEVKNKIKNIDDVNVEILFIDDNNVIYQDKLSLSENNIFKFSIDNPKLWYPAYYGEQPLYDLIVRLVKSNKIIDEKTAKQGIRKCEIVREKDRWGESFTVTINDQPIFLKGSDYIIEDNIFPRRNNMKTTTLLEAARDSYQNCIRVWGGAMFPDDHFYNECDRLGLIVWQDLMFACGYYNMENELFVSEIKEEIIDNLMRIRSHACIGLICGNNENETAITWNVPNVEYTKKWYLYQYEEYIPPIVKSVVPNIFYWPSSPSSGGGFDNPNDDSRGDMHYWGVWHNNEPIEAYRTYFPRVMSEFGMQSFPSMKTIKSFTIEEDRNIFSYVMERHQKNTSANQKIMNYIGAMERFPNSFESLVYLSQINQAEAVRYCVEHLRRNYGRCMGAIYWQLNDCWPVASWSSIDYYGRYKTLQYHAKKFNRPLIISIEEDKDNSTAKVVITNETATLQKCKCKVILKTFDEEVLKLDNYEVEVEPYSTYEVCNNKYDLSFDEKINSVLYVTCDNGVEEINNSVSFERDKYLNLPKCKIDYELIKNGDEYILKLHSNAYCKFVYLDVKNTDVIFSDNYFNMFKDEEKIITFKSNKEIIGKNILIKSLRDSYN